jgi:UDP-N-acetylmuramate dehydrogenase
VGRLVVPETSEQVVEAVREADGAGDPLLVIGGGSNLVVGDVGWDGTVVKVGSTGIDIRGDRIVADAGVDWDRLVAVSVLEGLSGMEKLSGVPGSVGGTPVQNVGAYGALTQEILEELTVLDRETGQVERWTADRCGFGSHRQSVFKHSDRWVVLDVTYRLERRERSGPIVYTALAGALGLSVGDTAPVADVREAVLAIRRSRKMVLDPDDHDTWSVGSFFINPVLPEVPPQVRAWNERAEAEGADGTRVIEVYPDVAGVKLPAGKLIHLSGFVPGFGLDWGNGKVALSSAHALVVTNRGGATTSDVMKFAAHIRAGVEATFGVRLGPECDLVHCSFSGALRRPWGATPSSSPGTRSSG